MTRSQRSAVRKLLSAVEPLVKEASERIASGIKLKGSAGRTVHLSNAQVGHILDAVINLNVEVLVNE